jgi:two-component system cell cycle response regulator
MSQSNTNLELRKKLKALMSNAQKYESKLQKMQQQELLFISASNLPELIDIILQQYRNTYELDYVSLLLIDHNHEIRHVIDFMNPGLLKLPTLIFSDSHTQLENVVIAQTASMQKTNPIDFQKTLFPNFKDEPYLGKCTGACRDTLFPGMIKEPHSVAILPLIRHNKLIGSLNLASLDIARFLAGTGTELIKRLSSILAVCIENAVNNEKLKLLGLTDALTGIHNRRYFMQRLEEEVVRSFREQRPISCLFIDIDHFKLFNDRYGHSVGDQVLRYVANIIKKQMRLSDVLARYGGEEFAVLLTNTDSALAVEVAERIRLSIANADLKIEGVKEKLNVTVSIGSTTIDHTRMTKSDNKSTRPLGESLLNSADQALYLAKDAGRNCVKVIEFDQIAEAQAIN